MILFEQPVYRISIISQTMRPDVYQSKRSKRVALKARNPGSDCQFLHKCSWLSLEVS